jgi:hypothetical protein
VNGDAGGRARLGFESVAISAFEFLVEEFGFVLSQRETSWLRYKRGELFVQIYHGRLSYEVGVELGLEGFVPAERTEPPVFMVQSFLGLLATPVDAPSLPTATTRRAVQRFVAELAIASRPVVALVVKNPESVFKRVWEDARVAADLSWEGSAAKRLREAADRAWLVRDLASVIASYDAFRREAPSVALLPSEAARLAYARKHVMD